MCRVSEELVRVAKARGAQMEINARTTRVDAGSRVRTVEFELGGKTQTVEANYVLMNAGRNVLAQLTGKEFQADASDEGSVFKINMLLKKLPAFIG